ncbi:MAG: radical SAM family heme chaperone HemW [Eubacteriales bacterium]|nr:radical SAM family heme chaperone HemW [Eubacteriales bacterium]
MKGLYVHIPFCGSKCLYCDFASYPRREADMPGYVDAVLREAEMRRAQWGSFAPDTIFWGGGTPSLLPVKEFVRLTKGLGEVLDLSRVREFTLEANPGTIDEEKLAAYAACGVDRMSLGLQAAQPALLKAIGRRHSPEDFARSVVLIRAAGIRRVNGDMMTGLPGQTVAQARETARFLTDAGVSHVSCYALKVEEGTPLYGLREAGKVQVPDDDAERDMFHAAREVLESAGYARYEISNFALPGEECLHNLLYWRRGQYWGLGCAAASFWGAERATNVAEIDEYKTFIDENKLPIAGKEELTPEDAAFEEIMLGLRLTRGVDCPGFALRHGWDLRERYRETIEGLKAQGLILQEGDRLRLTRLGMDVQNHVLLEFM